MPAPRWLGAHPSAGTIRARNVVSATGPFQRPHVPGPVADLAREVFQVHASDYRNPDQLPAGGVLVVGAGASGFQLAEELLETGRPTYVSVSRHRRMPRRYRGHDLFWLARALGRLRPVSRRLARRPDATPAGGHRGGRRPRRRCPTATGRRSRGTGPAAGRGRSPSLVRGRRCVAARHGRCGPRRLRGHGREGDRRARARCRAGRADPGAANAGARGPRARPQVRRHHQRGVGHRLRLRPRLDGRAGARRHRCTATEV